MLLKISLIFKRDRVSGKSIIITYHHHYLHLNRPRTPRKVEKDGH